MERLVTVEFGPSRSRRFGRALAEARSGAGECSEVEPGRHRVSFTLGTGAAAYTGLARLLERVRHWRATEVHDGNEPLSAFHVREMAWCASSQLKSFRRCRFRFYYGVLPRCSVCPLFDAERAIREGENPPPALVLEISLPHRCIPPGQDASPELDPGWQVPDFPPQEWEQPTGEQPPG
jgi:hypothetical protein